MDRLTVFWNRRAELYGHTGWKDIGIYAFDQNIRLNIVKVLNGSIHRGSLLDYGCGSGDFSKVLLPLYDGVWLYDISSTVLSKAQRNMTKDTAVRCCFISDYNELVDNKQQFDTVISITVLQHILDDKELYNTLVMLREKLRKDGRFIIMESFTNKQINNDYERSWDWKYFSSLMEKCGFVIVKGYDSNFAHPKQACNNA